MSLRKSTRAEGGYRVHSWEDPSLQFLAECLKHGDKWVAEVKHSPVQTFATYQAAVDWIMDAYRLAQAGLDSWDSRAVLLATLDGWDWADLEDEERQGYLNLASANARRQEGL